MNKFIRFVATYCLLVATSTVLFATVLTDNKEDKDKINILCYNMRIAHPPSKGWNETDLPATARVINGANPEEYASDHLPLKAVLRKKQ